MKNRFWGFLASVILLVVFAVLISNKASSPDNVRQTENENVSAGKGETKTNISAPGAQPNVRYMIILEDNRLCTYKVEGSHKSLLRQSEITPLLMSHSDVEKLQKGIYSDNLEQIYLYYESYSS